MSEDNNNLIKHAQLYWSKQLEPISCEFDDIYFNTEKGMNESLYVFIQGNNLKQRWLECPNEHFAIAETGFGTGLNFLLTCLQFSKFLSSKHDGQLRRLHFTSFEKYPLSKQDLSNALQKWPQLSEFITPLLQQYPIALTGCHRINLDKFNITLDLWLGDVLTNLPNLYIYDSGLFDCWYLDGFAPSKNPDMWSETLFELIAKTCKNNATIATFTSAGFVRRSLISAGFNIQKRKGYGKKREMLVGNIVRNAASIPYGQHYRQSKHPTTQVNNNDVAIIGGGIASACLTLALLKRGYKVSLYCKDATFAIGGSGNEQGALYPLLNEKHDALSQLFANAFLFSRNYVEQVNQNMPFDFDLSGLLQLYYDPNATKKLDKIIRAKLPEALVRHLDAEETDTIAGIDINQQALFYPLAGWLSPKQMVEAIFNLAKTSGNLTIHFSHQLNSFSEKRTTESNSWDLHFTEKTVNHNLLILCSAMNTLNFKQCEAIPLSAARGQVTHISSNTELKKLKVTLCHEGYLTPEHHNKHCMGATFKRHVVDETFKQSEQTENKDKLQKCIKDKHWADEIDVNHTDANVGIRCTTRDHFPYVGAVPDYLATKLHYRDAEKNMNPENAPFHQNLYMLTGLGSRGLCTAPLLADMLASQINKEPLPFPTAILNAIQGNRQWVNYLKKGKLLKF